MEALEAGGTNALRLASLPGREGWVERFGTDVLVSHRTSEARDRLVQGLDRWLAANRSSTWRPSRLFCRELVTQPGEHHAVPRQIAGPPAISGKAYESGLAFEIDFGAGYSVGLFIDQRANRRRLKELRPAKVLNCFAYTCAFSLAGAAAGAETLSVDLSRKSLDWGRRNFNLNGLDPGDGRHRFLADDVFRVLPRLARRGEQFDALILDPPTFSRGAGGKVFRVERDFPSLIEEALGVAGPQARILLSANRLDLAPADLAAMARQALNARGRKGGLRETEALPDIPLAQAPAGIWIELNTPS